MAEENLTRLESQTEDRQKEGRGERDTRELPEQQDVLEH